MTRSNLVRWEMVRNTKYRIRNTKYRDGYYFLEGREEIVAKRKKRKEASQKKLILARRAAEIIGRVPTVKLVAITGSLAMMNAEVEADIDLMIITRAGRLWTSRAIILIILIILRIPVRRAGEKNQKNKLCLNMWLDETALTWPKKNRNPFVAHEIAQIIPLIDKDKTYEKFLASNRWVLNYWPNSLEIRNSKLEIKQARFNFIESLAYKMQSLYMKNKLTCEKVSRSLALFHPKKLC